MFSEKDALEIINLHREINSLENMLQIAYSNTIKANEWHERFKRMEREGEKINRDLFLQRKQVVLEFNASRQHVHYGVIEWNKKMNFYIEKYDFTKLSIFCQQSNI